MRAFELYLNNRRLCTAGIGDDGVLDTLIDHIAGNGRNELFLTVGGLISPADEHVRWTRRRLKKGDDVRVKIIETTSVDRPKERHRRDRKQELADKKRYVRKMAQEFGWQLTMKRRRMKVLY